MLPNGPPVPLALTMALTPGGSHDPSQSLNFPSDPSFPQPKGRGWPNRTEEGKNGENHVVFTFLSFQKKNFEHSTV